MVPTLGDDDAPWMAVDLRGIFTVKRCNFPLIDLKPRMEKNRVILIHESEEDGRFWILAVMTIEAWALLREISSRKTTA